MRCPKCGYISFDHVDTCLKCKKDISGKVEVTGTTYHATAPSFLKVPSRESQEGENDFIGNGEEFDSEDYEFSDPDLDVLVGDDDEFAFDDEATISFDDADLGEVEDEFQLEADTPDEDDNLGFDFDDDDDFGEEQAIPELSVPNELSDISDLAPPELEETPAASSVANEDMHLSLDDEVTLDEDIDLDGLDLNLGLGDDSDDSEVALSLDDIDISMDEGTSFDDGELDSLNMDLDLDDFDTEEPKQKDSHSSGSLDGISLSLD